ncbi:NAD(P)/FAD-dependent oxidoreductase [Roseomonas sp. CECT 9278]|uniref:FAD-dependent oxidoreductase n=1 Tax=Roseomonas sp. CECT 9278 TaxID=2845823 RepID=UPI001E4E43CB|nr:NAD(P)/FAD-dependent oxidoreductase [Roseomonas sp. CECT 9278]CAH0133837.1 FAD-dependent urate hydroxylase [Roseomonas sp. CECT 9278]
MRDVAVVGAGVAGLAVATLLARAGHRVSVLERFDRPAPVGSGLMLQPTGLAALDRLGLRAEIEALGARIDRLHGTTDRGATVFDLAYGDLAPGLHALAVHRAALHGVLWRAFAACGAGIETARPVAGITEHADRILLHDAAGATLAEADIAIDASGARSVLRALVEPAPPRAFAYGAVWASVPDPGLAPGMLLQRYVAARIMLGWLPVGRAEPGGPPLAALFWSLKPGDHAAWVARYGDWCEQAAALWPPIAPVLAALPGPQAFSPATYIQFTAKRPWRGRLVLLGDAAHATSPQLGQGANNAMLDALALADALAAEAGHEAAFARYAAARRAHVRFYQRASAVMTPFFQSDARSLAMVRDLVFDRLKVVPWLRREMIRTLAGLKTGLLTHRDAATLAGGATAPPSPGPAPVHS